MAQWSGVEWSGGRAREIDVCDACTGIKVIKGTRSARV